MRKPVVALAILLLLTGLVLPFRVAAQSDDRAVVRAVLFFSPSCPHCHEVMERLLTPMQAQYGDQLDVAAIDTSQPDGARLYQAAIQWYKIPPQRRGVPLLVVDDIVLIGSLEIPNQFPAIARQGLDGGGIDWPAFPGLDRWIAEREQGGASEAGATPSGVTATATPAQREGEEGECLTEAERCLPAGPGIVGEGAGFPEWAGPPLPSATPSGVVRLVFFWADT